MQRAKGIFGLKGDHGTFADDDGSPSNQAPSAPKAEGAAPGAVPAPGVAPAPAKAPVATPAAAKAPADPVALARAALEEELRREKQEQAGQANSPPQRVQSQSQLHPQPGAQASLDAASVERAEERRQRRKSKAKIKDTGECSDNEAFAQFEGNSTGAPTPVMSHATPWGVAQPPSVPTSPAIGALSATSPATGALSARGDAQAAFSKPPPSITVPTGNTPVHANAVSRSGDLLSIRQPETRKTASEASASQSQLYDSKQSTAPGQFDEAILAALSALPRHSLIDILRRLQGNRPEEVRVALGVYADPSPLSTAASGTTGLADKGQEVSVVAVPPPSNDTSPSARRRAVEAAPPQASPPQAAATFANAPAAAPVVAPGAAQVNWGAPIPAQATSPVHRSPMPAAATVVSPSPAPAVTAVVAPCGATSPPRAAPTYQQAQPPTSPAGQGQDGFAAPATSQHAAVSLGVTSPAPVAATVAAVSAISPGPAAAAPRTSPTIETAAPAPAAAWPAMGDWPAPTTSGQSLPTPTSASLWPAPAASSPIPPPAAGSSPGFNKSNASPAVPAATADAWGWQAGAGSPGDIIAGAVAGAAAAAAAPDTGANSPWPDAGAWQGSCAWPPATAASGPTPWPS